LTNRRGPLFRCAGQRIRVRHTGSGCRSRLLRRADPAAISVARNGTVVLTPFRVYFRNRVSCSSSVAVVHLPLRLCKRLNTVGTKNQSGDSLRKLILLSRPRPKRARFAPPPSPSPRGHWDHADNHRERSHYYGPESCKSCLDSSLCGIAELSEPFLSKRHHQNAVGRGDAHAH